MTYRTARRGAAVAGASLFALPIMEVLFGFAHPGNLR